MYTAEQIKAQKAKEAFSPVVGKRVYTQGDDINKVIETIDLLRIDLFVQGLPETIINVRDISLEDSGFTQINVYIRPTRSYTLKTLDTAYSFIIDVNENIYTNFIIEYAKWVDNYLALQKIESNLTTFTSDIHQLLSENDVELPFDLTFELGTPLKDISNTHVVVGLSQERVLNLSKLGMYDAIDLRADSYKSRIVDFFRSVLRPSDLYSIDAQITRDLELLTRKSFSGMVRRLVTRKVDKLHTGVGYYDKDNTFAIVERVAIKEEEVADYEAKGYLVQDNNKALVRDSKNNRTKIASRFKLNPFAKKADEEVNAPKLEDILYN